MSGWQEYSSEQAEAGTGMNRNKLELNHKSTTLLTDHPLVEPLMCMFQNLLFTAMTMTAASDESQLNTYSDEGLFQFIRQSPLLQTMWTELCMPPIPSLLAKPAKYPQAKVCAI
jgi:hypothetical protein